MRHIKVRVKPNADDNVISRQADDILQVTTTEPANSGRANDAVIEAVSDYLSASGRIRIVSGHKSRQKILAIED